MAQRREIVTDPEQKIARPRQVFIGPRRRHFVPAERRKDTAKKAG